MGLYRLSRTVSELNVDLGRKSQNFPTPVYFAAFAPPLTGFPLELGIGARSQNYDGATGPRKKFDDILSRILDT